MFDPRQPPNTEAMIHSAIKYDRYNEYSYKTWVDLGCKHALPNRIDGVHVDIASKKLRAHGIVARHCRQVKRGLIMLRTHNMSQCDSQRVMLISQSLVFAYLSATVHIDAGPNKPLHPFSVAITASPAQCGI
jgi:hypothetical protein